MMKPAKTCHYRDDYGNSAMIVTDSYGITLVVNPGYCASINHFTNINEAKRAMRTITDTTWREVNREWEYVS